MRRFLTREMKRLGQLAERRVLGEETNFSWTKYKNTVLNSLEYEQRKSVLKSHPSRVYIDPTNICNLRCPLCPTGQGLMPSQGKMPLDTFRSILDILGKYVGWVGLYNWGEPLLHTDIFEMVRLVTAYCARSVIGTNFNVPFSEERVKEMIESGLSQLIVSLDGASPETYQQYRVGGDFNRIIDNLELLAETKRLKNSLYPEVVLQFIAFSHNEHELEQMKPLAQKFDARLVVERAMCDMGGIADVSARDASRQFDTWLPVNPEYRRYDEKGNWVFTNDACSFLWNTMVFRWDGEVFPCCIPYRDQDGFGNINDSSIEEIWNGPLYQHARSLFSIARGPDDKLGMVCDRCYANKGWNVVMPNWFD